MRGSPKSLHQTSRAKMSRAAAWTLNHALQSGISNPPSMPIHPQCRLQVAHSVSTFPLFFPLFFRFYPLFPLCTIPYESSQRFAGKHVAS